jgi:hypothetical protein
VLQFFALPLIFEPDRDLGPGSVMLGQVGRVGIRAGFDERGAHQQEEQVLVVLYGAAIDGREVNVFNAPVGRAVSARGG